MLLSVIAHLLGVMLVLGGFPAGETVTPPVPDPPVQAAEKLSKPKKAKTADRALKNRAKSKTKKSKKKNKQPGTDRPAPDEQVDPDVGQQGAVDAPGRFVWKQHPSFRYKNILHIDFEAKMQEDGHSSYEGADKTAGLSTWGLHHNRFGVQGTSFKRIDFEVEREFTEQELTEKDVTDGITPKSQWKDVNLKVSYFKNAQVQVGKFKIPFGLDELTGVTHNDFVYRSAGANYLAPARDIGAMVHGRFFKKGLSYWTGMFVHDGDNARSKKIAGGDQTFATRISGKPLRRANPGLFDNLEIGSARALTHVTDDSFRPHGLRGRTAMTQDTFALPVYVKGQRSRWEADVDWTLEPGSLRAEYTHVTDERLGQSYTDSDLSDARYQSWYVQGTWLQTGEPKTRPVKPALDFLGGGVGAVELTGRYDRIWFDSVDGTAEAFANPRAENILLTGERAVTLGVNWTLNRVIKLQFNAIREHVDNPDAVRSRTGRRSGAAPSACRWFSDTGGRTW